MRQVLHLFIVDPEGRAALTAWLGTKWLLPVLTCAERARADPALLRWVNERGIACQVAGQWLGRIGPDVTDWLMVVRAKRSDAADPVLRWIPLQCLAQAAALIEYQGWAVTQSLQRGSLPSVAGPFGNVMWVDDVTRWIADATGGTPPTITPYRVTAHEVVLAADTSVGPVYFKGLTADRAVEARLTRTLAAVAPGWFARTVASDERPDGSVWWLTAGCQGAAGGDAAAVAHGLARLQRRVMASGPVLRQLRELDIAAAVRWACELVDDAASADAIRRHAHSVETANVPVTWIPLDLDPTNVLVDDSGRVRFIDLDDSYHGPAPLAMATFARRCRDASLHRMYEQSWSPPLTDVDWRAFDIVAAVLEAWHGWQRFERNGHRGEVHGAFDIAANRIRSRIARSLHLR